ncbi:hypothetical protein [Microbacterium hydrocarbonoxydans]|uniref:DUF4013 domain-containing protein n=2 Tax=Microbacterium hydrocarbonoxydans TaxID=273678 RepID=A0A1H4QEQ2_9MICO|nr:hypothetical protein [Microbacterium hydrocarbonoxydans]SEC18089.1 hypothetical protein SAMN04489807_3081 [Microbacterium hydrocarbonoxydans]
MSEERRARRAATREARSGAGPTVSGVEPGVNPGATAKFGLFGEVLTIGLMMTVVALGVVTLPIALAAGIRHLRRFVAAEDSRAGLFWEDVRAGILSSLVVGVPAAVIAAVLTIDVLVAGSGALPGGQAIAVVGWAGLLVLSVALLAAAGAWSPALGWIGAVRAVPSVVRADAAGAAYLAAAAVFTGVVTWALAPLFIAGIGCAALAVVAVPARRRRGVHHAG